MYNQECTEKKDENSKLVNMSKRKLDETSRSSRRKLLRRKIHRTIPAEEKYSQNAISSQDEERVLLINPQSVKIPSSHNAMEQANQSEVPETAYYPSSQNHNYMMGLQMGDGGLQGAPEFIPLGSPHLPPMECPEDDLESHQYQEIMQMLLQAIHNQNRIMEECRNILTSIHHAIAPLPPPPPPVSQASFNTLPMSQPTFNPPHPPLVTLWNPSNEPPQQVEEQPPPPPIVIAQPAVVQPTAPQQTPPPKPVDPPPNKMLHQPALPKSQSSSCNTTTTNTTTTSSNKKHNVKMEPKEGPLPLSLVPTNAQPPTMNLQTVSSSKEPDKPTVYGPDGEFSSAYLRYVYSKSSTATSFANVLMKEVFNLEERISSNCNGVMGKKALEAERLDKIKRAVKRFYTDTEEEFQDLWKKCRKSIDSTNRNLKFVIMKKPSL